MNRSSRHLQFFAVLCLAAVMLAQMLGIKHSYVCTCSGEPKLTDVDHCHAWDEAITEQAGEAEGCGEKDVQWHAEVKFELQGTMNGTDELLFAPPLALEVVLEYFTPLPSPTVVRSLGSMGSSPPPGVTVARTVVLLI